MRGARISLGVKLIGCAVKKFFEQTLFTGSVTEYDPTEGFYKVLYDDGDEEELEYEELQPILVEVL